MHLCLGVKKQVLPTPMEPLGDVGATFGIGVARKTLLLFCSKIGGRLMIGGDSSNNLLRGWISVVRRGRRHGRYALIFLLSILFNLLIKNIDFFYQFTFLGCDDVALCQVRCLGCLAEGTWDYLRCRFPCGRRCRLLWPLDKRFDEFYGLLPRLSSVFGVGPPGRVL